MKQKDGMIVALLGVIAGLLIVLVFQFQSAPNAVGQTAAAKSDNYLMATSLAQSTPVCFIYKCDVDKLAVYQVLGESLKLLAVRGFCTLDWSVKEYGKNIPDSKKMEQDTGGNPGGKKKP